MLTDHCWEDFWFSTGLLVSHPPSPKRPRMEDRTVFDSLIHFFTHSINIELFYVPSTEVLMRSEAYGEAMG